MSVGLEVFAINLQPLRDSRGSGDAQILSRYEAALVDALNEDERGLEPHDQHEDGITIRQALRNYIEGNIDVSNTGLAQQYYWMSKSLCEQFGTLLDAQGFESLPSDSVTGKLDLVLLKKGVAEKIRYYGIIEVEPSVNPLGFSPGDEAGDRGIGYVEYENVMWILERLEPFDIMGIDKPVALCLISIYNWLKHAREAKQDLIFICC